MVAGVRERDSGLAEESLLARATARAWTDSGTGLIPIPVRMDAVVPGKDARRALVAIAEDLRRWDVEARTERAYWEPGGTGTRGWWTRPWPLTLRA
jgi:hypothetical protein